jgi:hypothetical protein
MRAGLLKPGPIRLRCPECRTTRVDPRLMTMHRLKCTRPLCHCLRVPHPHRPGGFPLCEQSPMSDVLLALLQGASDEEAADIATTIAFERGGIPSKACPF